MDPQEDVGLGAHAMWGYTPAKDLLEDCPIGGEANILVCQPGDIGHILRTISSRRRHPQHTINLYVWELQPEVLARHMLLWQVAQDWELPIRQRATLFLEIYGNSLVQERTSRYIANQSKKLVDMLYSMEATSDNVDLSLLKCKQKDLLEEIFKFWGGSNPCDIRALRDRRLRRFFGTRYDHRKNLVDWDYTTRLKDVASIIHHKQYRSWRLGGIAHEFGDQVYDYPNRTMTSHAEGTMLKGRHKGMKKEIRGFWLDIRVGPFITFGVSCECPNKYAEDLFAILNKGTGTEQHRHNTAEVAVYSMLSYFWELESGKRYLMTKKNEVYSGLGEYASLGSGDAANLASEAGAHEQERHERDDQTRVNDAHTSEKSNHDSNPAETCDDKHKSTTPNRTERFRHQDAHARAQCIVDTLDGITICLMSGDLAQQLSKTRFHKHFDRVHIGLTAVNIANSPEINKALADQAVITMDTGRYMVPFSEDQQLNFVKATCSMAQKRGWRSLCDETSSPDGSYIPASNSALSLDSIGFSFTRMPTNA